MRGSGEEELELDLAALARRGEVAWLHAADAGAADRLPHAAALRAAPPGAPAHAILGLWRCWLPRPAWLLTQLAQAA